MTEQGGRSSNARAEVQPPLVPARCIMSNLLNSPLSMCLHAVCEALTQ